MFYIFMLIVDIVAFEIQNCSFDKNMLVMSDS